MQSAELLLSLCGIYSFLDSEDLAEHFKAVFYHVDVRVVVLNNGNRELAYLGTVSFCQKEEFKVKRPSVSLALGEDTSCEVSAEQLETALGVGYRKSRDHGDQLDIYL